MMSYIYIERDKHTMCWVLIIVITNYESTCRVAFKDGNWHPSDVY
jgi:hypothetical protein